LSLRVLFLKKVIKPKIITENIKKIKTLYKVPANSELPLVIKKMAIKSSISDVMAKYEMIFFMLCKNKQKHEKN